MGFDDLCNTGLVLGLGFSSSSTVEYKSKKPVAVKNISEPSLTLCLSDETYDHVKKVDSDNNNNNNIYKGAVFNDHQDLYRQDSGVSSLSNVSVKRERDFRSEEAEIERVNNNNNNYSSRLNSDEDDDGSNGRKKLRLTKAQSALLEESFKIHITLNPKQKQDLARDLKLRPRQVEVWFQNRRARTKLKQTEVDCEFLKKCCESLTDENQRLQKELKALKLAQPMYMQLPAATLTMCPSCERIGASSADNSAKSPFVVAPKPHFYNPFANSSAAC